MTAEAMLASDFATLPELIRAHSAERGQKAALACNNFARAPVCVDNRSVVPILSTDLHTAVLCHCLIPPESTKPASGQERGLWKKKGPTVNNRTLVGGRQN